MTTEAKRCCANCGAWDRSSEEWEHTQWKTQLYKRIMEDQESDEKQQRETEWERGRKLKGRSMLQASCLGLGWGQWGVCNLAFGRGKAILCWDEKRGYHAPLYEHLVTAHDFCCSEWTLPVEREPTLSFSPILEEVTETIKCPGCGDGVTLHLQRYEPTGQEYSNGECKNCKVLWTRS